MTENAVIIVYLHIFEGFFTATGPKSRISTGSKAIPLQEQLYKLSVQNSLTETYH